MKLRAAGGLWLALLCVVGAALLACPQRPLAKACGKDLDCPHYSYCETRFGYCVGYQRSLGRCGDGWIQHNLSEQCDDGNRSSGDGCSSTCQMETAWSCGDGVLDLTLGEQCDDGQQCFNGKQCQRNSQCVGIGIGFCQQHDGDGCSAACQVEVAPSCGNGRVDLRWDEQCDDGKRCEDGNRCDDASDCVGVGRGTCAPRSGDGCSRACRFELRDGRCGDGQVQAGEVCDNGEGSNGDLCSSSDASCSCAAPCECNWSCSLRNTTRLLTGQPGSFGNQDGAAAEATLGGDGQLLVVGDWLYYADAGNHTIRRVRLSNGEVSTIAGDAETSTAGYLDDPIGLIARFDFRVGALASNGRTLWLADDNNHVIRGIGLKPPHPVSTVSGRMYRSNTAADVCHTVVQSSLCYRDHQDPALVELGVVTGLAYYQHNLYLVEREASTLRRLNLATGAVDTLAGQPTETAREDGDSHRARFYQPSSLIGDGSGRFFIGERTALRLFQLHTGQVTTLFTGAGVRDGDWSSSPVSCDRPAALASDGGNIFWVESHWQVVRQAHLSTTTVSTVVGFPGTAGYLEGTGNQAQLNAPTSVVLEPGSRSLLVLDSGNAVIRWIE